MEQEKDNELQKYIDYYNDEKESAIAFCEAYDYLNYDANYEEKIKDRALQKTIAKMEEQYKIHSPKVELTSLLSIGAGTTAGAVAYFFMRHVVQNTDALGATIATAVGVGTTILAEYAQYKTNKDLQEYDKRARKAAEIEQGLRKYRSQDNGFSSPKFVKNSTKATERTK